MARTYQRITTCLAMLFSVFTSAHGSSSVDDHWVRDEHGCQAFNPNPHPKPGESIKWSGVCKNSYLEGPGLLEWFDKNGVADGWRKGSFVRGYLQGAGELQTPKGTHYQGQFRDGLQNGHGTLVFVDGTRYDGDFRDGKADGLGAVLWPNGTRFKGEFKSGKSNGHGTMLDPSGASFDGTFKDGLAVGHGIVQRPDGTKVEVEIGNGGTCVSVRDRQSTNAASSECGDEFKRLFGSPDSETARDRSW
jgi:hypothetical protein